jgi:hypothetical protein
MAGIGEASAIVATIQVGFSLAKTLIAVVSDYKSAREDISCVATEVDATLNQAAELDALVKNNATTRRLNDRGLKLAEKCKVDSTRIVDKLMRLLTKAGVPEDQPSTIEPEDIEVSNFSRAAWVFLKPQIIVIQRELNSIRLQILLAHTCIDAESAPSEKDRVAASKLVPGLRRSRQLACRLVREAQIQSDKANESAMSNRGMDLQSAPGISGISSPPAHRGSRATNGARISTSRRPLGREDVVPQTQAPHRNALNDSDTDQVAEEIRRELEQELLTKLENKVKERDAVRASEKRLRDEAVERYKQDTRERLSTMKERSAATRQRLHATFTSELPDSEVQSFLDAQHQQELHDDFVELMIDEYKVPPLQIQHKQDIDTLSRHAESSRDSTKRYALTWNLLCPFCADIPTSWLSKILPARSRRTSLYFGSVHSEEDPAPIFETRYIHLQIVSHHDRPSLLPLDNSTFSHLPCNSVCDAQRTSTIWASLSPLCEALILDYLSRNCPLPAPAKWQLHSAWPVTQQLSRRGRYLQRALLGSQLLSWQGNFVVVFSALVARPQSPGDQVEVRGKEQPTETKTADSQQAAITLAAATDPATSQPIHQQINRAIGSATQQPESIHRDEHATLQVKPSTLSQSAAPDQWPSQQHNPNAPQTGPQSSFSDHPSWQLVPRPSSMYPQAPYGSMPYAPPFMPSASSAAQTYDSMGDMYPPPAGYYPPGSLAPHMSPNPFTPYGQPPYGYPSAGMPHAPTAPYNDPIAQNYPSQLPANPATADGQWPAPNAHPQSMDLKPHSHSHRSEPKSRKKFASVIPRRNSHYKPRDNTSTSSSSGPESIYPLKTSTVSGTDFRHAKSMPTYPSSSSGRRSTVTFGVLPPPSLQRQAASSTTRRSSSRHEAIIDPYKAVLVRPTDEGTRDHSSDEAVASDDDASTFDDMVVQYMGSGRPTPPHKASVRP